MKLSRKRLALIVGTFIFALMAVEGLLRLQGSAQTDYGFGTSHLVAADSAGALFLVGLVGGVVLGIAIFFSYLVWRERRLAEEPNDLDLLLKEIAEEEKRNALFVDENSFREERSESRDPWERSADWWKGSDEE